MSEKEFSLKGLSFDKKDLKIISLDELGEKQICPGHIIFMSAKFGKPVLLLRAGDFVDSTFVEKYKAKGQKSFYILQVTNDEAIEKFESLWMKVKIAKFENESLLARKELLKYFSEAYWYNDSQSCVLDYYSACFKTFSRLSDEILVQLRETSNLLFERAIQVASLSAMVALAIGYTDFEVISDVFHVSLLLDFGLTGDKFSFHIAQACEKERAMPGEGIKYLKSVNAPQAEIKIFEQHPNLSHLNVFNRCYGAFYNLEMMKIISYHHENRDGSGLPNKFNFWGLADIDVVPGFVDAMVPHSEVIYQADNGGGTLKKLVDELESAKKLDILPVRRIYDRLTTVMSEALVSKEETKEEQTEEVAVVGDEPLVKFGS
ncbi:MAG: hypothetical protein JNM93_12680 [Bacteriovoracaceae bacterium]|nr:hypothetical protein [Bacteriovoracaceae bacterium]